MAAAPEEKVRQKLLDHMVRKLRFPANGLAVEKSLDQLPHLQNSPIELPQRRADIVYQGNDIHAEWPIYPLLLVECKAVPLTDATIRQVTGYNYYLKSYFVAIANDREIKMGWFDKDKQDYEFIPFLPPYEQLLRSLVIA